MSLHRWLAHGVSRFFSWMWLGKFDRLVELLRPSNQYRKRPDTRLELTSLENRENPLAIWACLPSGVVVGELVLSAAHQTLQDVILSGGWDSPGYHLPPLGSNIEYASTQPLALELPPRDSTTVMAGFTPAQRQESTSAATSEQGHSDQSQDRANNDLGDWLSAVAAELDRDALQRGAGNRTSLTDPLGHTGTYAYDALNRRTTVTDALNHTSTTSYDAVGNVLTGTDPLGNVTSNAYDTLYRRTTETDAVGSGVQRTKSWGYDAVGNVTTSTDALGKVTTAVYDALDRVTQITDPLNHITTMGYNAAGSVLTSLDALSQTMTYTYNALNQLDATTDALGNTTTSVLDASGATAATVDALGNASVNIINSLGQNSGSVDAQGNVPMTVLDPLGGARMVVDPVGNETHYVVDGLDRATVVIDPLGNRTTTAFDAAGRPTQVTDRNSRVIQYSFDGANRETGEVWKSAAGATVNMVTYGYDNANNQTSAADYNGTVSYTFDALNRVQSYSNVFGQVLTYSFDGNDHVTKRTDSLGGTLTSVYDDAGWLSSKQFSGTGATGTVVRVDFGYDSRNEQTSITWLSNLAGTTVVASSVYSYDNSSRLTGIVNKNSTAATLSYYNYTYDNADRVSNHTWSSQIGTVTYSGSNTYTYDSTSQLLSDGTNNYSYDSNGNRTMSGYATGTDNRMTNDGTYTYTYEAAGNMTQKSKGAGLETWYYGYDTRNNLTSIRETSNGTTNILTVTYTYDVEDKRVKEQTWQTGGSTVETRFAFDGQNVWADLDSSNTILVRRLFEDGAVQPLTRTVASGLNAGVWVYLTDNLGSVRDLVNWIGQVQDHLDYSGFGVLTESTASVGDAYAFTGLKEQKAAGVLLAWHRPGMLAAGRWMQEDPMRFRAGDPNLYRYVKNNATNQTDVLGLMPNQADAVTLVEFIAFVQLVELQNPGKPPLWILHQVTAQLRGGLYIPQMG